MPLRGIVPPVITPLLGPDTLDLEGLQKLLDRMVAAGCVGVFVLGTTGEAQALSYRLRLEVVREACRIVKGRVPVLVGVTDTSVVESVQLGRAAAEAGATALVIAQPYYFRMGQSDLLRHAEMLAKELTLPLFLYNIPSLTKLVYEPETVAAAMQIPGVVGFKDSSGDLLYLQRVLRLVSHRPEFTVLIGPEELLAEAILMGAHGGISGGANLRPELYVQLHAAASAGRLEEVQALKRTVLELSEGVYRVGEPSTSYLRGLKCALELDGICSGLPAAPLSPFTPEERAMLASRMEQLQAVA